MSSCHDGGRRTDRKWPRRAAAVAAGDERATGYDRASAESAWRTLSTASVNSAVQRLGVRCGVPDDPCCCHEAVTCTSSTRATSVSVLVSGILRGLRGDRLVDRVAVIGVHRRRRRQIHRHLRLLARVACRRAGERRAFGELADPGAQRGHRPGDRDDEAGAAVVGPLHGGLLRCQHGQRRTFGRRHHRIRSARRRFRRSTRSTSFGRQHDRRILRGEPRRFDQQVGHRNRPCRDEACGSPARALPVTTRAHPPTSAATVRTVQQTTGSLDPRGTRRTVRPLLSSSHCLVPDRFQARGGRSHGDS